MKYAPIANIALLATLTLFWGCADEEPPLPEYRGSWIRNLPINETLIEHWRSENGFDPNTACVQMITRDKTEDGVRKLEKIVLFSPDACPADNSVASRESFLAHFTETTIDAAAKLPTTAYHIVKDEQVIGTIALTQQEPREYELADVCTLVRYHRENCEIEFTVTGDFAAANTLRAPVGRMIREERLLNTLLDRMTALETTLRGDLTTVQRNLVSQLQNEMTRLDTLVQNRQNAQAQMLLNTIKNGVTHLEITLTRTNRANTEEILRGIQQVRQQLSSVENEIKATIVKEIGHHFGLLKQQLAAAMTTLQEQYRVLGERYDEIQKRHKELGEKILEKIGQAETSINNNIWDATWESIFWIEEYLELIDEDLRKFIDEKRDEVTQEVIKQTELLRKQIGEFRKDSKKWADEIKAQLTDNLTKTLDKLKLIDKHLDAIDIELANILKSIDTAKEAIIEDNEKNRTIALNYIEMFLLPNFRDALKKHFEDRLRESEDRLDATIREAEGRTETRIRDSESRTEGRIRESHEGIESRVGDAERRLDSTIRESVERQSLSIEQSILRLDATVKESLRTTTNELANNLDRIHKILVPRIRTEMRREARLTWGALEKFRYQQRERLFGARRHQMDALQKQLDQLIQNETTAQFSDQLLLIEENLDEVLKIHASKLDVNSITQLLNMRLLLARYRSQTIKEIQNRLVNRKQDILTALEAQGEPGKAKRDQLKAFLASIPQSSTEKIIGQAQRLALNLGTLGIENRGNVIYQFRLLLQRHNRLFQRAIKDALNQIVIQLRSFRLGGLNSVHAWLEIATRSQFKRGLAGLKKEVDAALADPQRAAIPPDAIAPLRLLSVFVDQATLYYAPLPQILVELDKLQVLLSEEPLRSSNEYQEVRLKARDQIHSFANEIAKDPSLDLAKNETLKALKSSLESQVYREGVFFPRATEKTQSLLQSSRALLKLLGSEQTIEKPTP